jgi:hypothetical protein
MLCFLNLMKALDEGIVTMSFGLRLVGAENISLCLELTFIAVVLNFFYHSCLYSEFMR